MGQHGRETRTLEVWATVAAVVQALVALALLVIALAQLH